MLRTLLLCALLSGCASRGLSSAPGILYAPPPPSRASHPETDGDVDVAMVTAETLLVNHLYEVLEAAGIEVCIGGGLAYAVEVPAADAKRARRVLEEDACRVGYPVELLGGGHGPWVHRMSGWIYVEASPPTSRLEDYVVPGFEEHIGALAAARPWDEDESCYAERGRGSIVRLGALRPFSDDTNRKIKGAYVRIRRGAEVGQDFSWNRVQLLVFFGLVLIAALVLFAFEACDVGERENQERDRQYRERQERLERTENPPTDRTSGD